MSNKIEQRPIGWFTEDHLTDKSATTYDPIVADRWRLKGWKVSPLFDSPPVNIILDSANAFDKGFNLLEQKGGKYQITMAFQNSDDAFDAYRQLAELRKFIERD